MVQYTPLVKRVVGQLASQVAGAADRHDLEQIGLLGLLDALRRYGEPDERFLGYATTRVRGAILDELRRLDWRPRQVRQEFHRIRDALRALTRKLGREPSEAEARAALGVSSSDFQDYLLAENAESLSSLDELIQQHDESWQSDVDEQAGPESVIVIRRSLEKALLALDEREQRVIQLSYEFDLSVKEIAAVLDLSESRVGQISRAALKKMRAVLA
ncbi:FliA/WhiG family RNA polymerase sigma factor [Paludibacterium sp. dN 18-1]|uniref:FliA/WhiG family RNA polymerase sigma factor n=1 Tax=Paludibacterium denitrificans TaxID=2675226 RepID=A0A844G932_9NEIS|nr:FliA/WhiG family RNA polymerase sigma factor [Paludibacterium denitrificans]